MRRARALLAVALESTLAAILVAPWLGLHVYLRVRRQKYGELDETRKMNRKWVVNSFCILHDESENMILMLVSFPRC